MPPTPYLSFTGLDEFVNKPVVENSKAMSSEEEPKVVRKSDGALVIEDWVLDNKEEDFEKHEQNHLQSKRHVICVEALIILQVDCITIKNSFKIKGWGKKLIPARPKAVVNVVKGNNVNVVKASACWVWKPKTKVLDHVSKHNSASITLKKFDCIDAQARSKETCPILEYKEIDGGYVAFGGNSKGGKIIGKGTIKTGNLDFENVYFAPRKNVKFNTKDSRRKLGSLGLVRVSPKVVGTNASDNAVQARKETEPVKNYILLPLWPVDTPYSQDPRSS
ncbi:hypothetical protein Tco_0963591 [Tanacetum coccineum]